MIDHRLKEATTRTPADERAMRFRFSVRKHKLRRHALGNVRLLNCSTVAGTTKGFTVLDRAKLPDCDVEREYFRRWDKCWWQEDGNSETFAEAFELSRPTHDHKPYQFCWRETGGIFIDRSEASWVHGSRRNESRYGTYAVELSLSQNDAGRV
jgi:hypothetical protein